MLYISYDEVATRVSLRGQHVIIMDTEGDLDTYYCGLEGGSRVLDKIIVCD